MIFLKKTTDYLYQKYKKELSKLLIISPNKRSGLFIRKHLAESASETILTPEIITIQEFITTYSKYNFIASDVVQLFLIYKAYTNVTEDIIYSFEEFTDIGSALIKDFNEIDAYRVLPEKLFNYLKNIKKIEHWGETSEHNSLIHILESAHKLYAEYKVLLSEKQMGYAGMLSRALADEIEFNPEIFIHKHFEQYAHIVFVGFNALSDSEESIIKQLIEYKKATIFWNIDQFFIENSHHQAGHFLRKLKQKRVFKDLHWNTRMLTEKKTINIHNCPTPLSQLNVVKHINFSKLGKNNSLSTAIVLADENLLTPLLLGFEETANITMGIPFRNSNINHFIELYITMYAELMDKKNYLNTVRKDSVTLIINHLILRHAFGRDAIDVITNIIQKTFYTVSLDTFNQINDALNTKILVTKDINYLTILNQLFKLIDLNKAKYESKERLSKSDKMELDNLFEASKILTQICNLNQEFPFINSMYTLKVIYKKLSAKHQTDFYGEPLTGLQIMGFLETRGLSFDNLIVLSANEGVLPKKRNYTSLIPNDVRYEYSLPTFQDIDALFAFHFYSLVKDAKNIHMFYYKESSDFSGCEKSRYILQLENDLKPFSHCHFKYHNHHYDFKDVNTKSISASSSATLSHHLAHIFSNHGISFSALNTYNNCSYSFYTKYILGIKETQKEEAFTSLEIGNIMHNVLERLYKPYEGKSIDLNTLKLIDRQVDSTLHKTFKEIVRYWPLEGEHAIEHEVIKTLIHRFIKQEVIILNNSQDKCFKIISLEKEYRHPVTVKLNNSKDIKVSVKGFIDRIDSLDGVVRIVDYKSSGGDFSPYSGSISKLKSKSLQLFIYVYLFLKNEGRHHMINAYMKPLRKSHQTFMSLFSEDTFLETSDLEKLELYISEKISEMLSEDTIFTHDSKSKYCLCEKLN